MFKSAGSFNQALGGWEVDNVQTMGYMFRSATSFNQDLSDWRLDSVTSMIQLFYYASAFDQDLGWCVEDDGVDLTDAFEETKCESTSCGVKQVDGACAPTPEPTFSPLVADDSTIETAVDAWLSNPTTAEATYGHISTWDTSGVMDMSWLFRYSSFNQDIGAWDTSGVTDGSFSDQAGHFGSSWPGGGERPPIRYEDSWGGLRGPSDTQLLIYSYIKR